MVTVVDLDILRILKNVVEDTMLGRRDVGSHYTETTLGTKLHVRPRGAHSTATSTLIGLMRNAVICVRGEGPAQSAHLMQLQAVGTMTVSVAVDAHVNPSGYQG
jgi:hypothetical protein